MSTLLKPVQRDPDPPGAAAAPLLDGTQIVDAKRFYKAQPWSYTSAIITQLRTSMGLSPEGGIDDDLVLGVAKFQVGEGSGSPGLKVDGKAGPRTLPRIFREGLNVKGEGEAFGGEVQTDVIDEWAKLGRPEGRRKALVDLVNKRLASAKVPPVTDAFDANPTNAGSFDFPTWRMLIGKDKLGTASINTADAKDIADTVYHEARHTQQWFRMAQLRAGQGLSAKGIVAELGIPADIAGKSRLAPLAKGSMEALVAQGWWESVYGSGSAHRVRVLTEVDAAEKASTKAQAKFDADPSEASQAALDAAKARFDKAFAAYQNLPEENDAWATGPSAAAGVTGGSPAPPAPVVDEPAGSPPPTGEKAHGTFPEEDILV